MTKREEKKAKIIEAAEVIFGQQGFSNANMNHIAAQAGVSKGTVYFYFDSKENLYMALAHKAITVLNEGLYQAVYETKAKNGKTTVLAIVEKYMEFGEEHPLYADAMLDYMTIVRGNDQGLDKQRTSKAMQESIYFSMLQDIHNLPLILVVRNINRGRLDGSIINQQPVELLYLTAWALILGYIKILKTSPVGKQTLFTIPLRIWRNSIISSISHMLTAESSD